MKTHSVRSEKGSVLLLVVVALTVVMGIVGLAMDAGQMYVTKQTAQAAADGAALAAIMDLFNAGETPATTANTFGPATITAADCAAGGAHSGVTPCAYARQNGFGVSAPEVTVAFGANCTTPAGVTLSATDPVNLICVTVSRVVNTTFMRVLGTTTSTVTATAEAAIVSGSAQIPIVITHPTRQTFTASGTTVICGGPIIGVQVNSSIASAASGVSINLSKAGPADPGDCTTGTGANFRVWGGPATKPAGINVGSASYVQPASPITDPLAAVPVPVKPAAAAAPVTGSPAAGSNGCPAGASCTLYSPGAYAGGIDIKGTTAVFKPGIYYITASGFTGDSNGCMVMATGFTDSGAGSTSTGWTGNMLVYNTGTGTFNWGANFGKADKCSGTSFLVGSPTNSVYEGILFFQDRASAAATHSLGGGGAVALNGTMYFTNTLATMLATPAHYQTLSLGGNSSITIGPVGTCPCYGGIVVDGLSVGNNQTLQINLSPQTLSGIRQVGLVQ